jgi:1-acyl-sn-glycerol-3-phosphate acyltransferase
VTFFVIASIIYLLTFPIDRYNQIPNKALRGLAIAMLKVNPGWTFEINGADLQKIERPTIVVSNHQSFLDLPLSYLLPWTMKWVAKKDLLKIPILGWIIFMTGHLAIDRKRMTSIKKLDELVKPIEQGIPAMIFPEGTRTQSGEVQPFKNGAFKLAKRYNFTILPIVLEGGQSAMPSGSWRIAYKQHFVISVLDPVESEQFDSQEELKRNVYSLIDRELTKLQPSTATVKDHSS